MILPSAEPRPTSLLVGHRSDGFGRVLVIGLTRAADVQLSRTPNQLPRESSTVRDAATRAPPTVRSHPAKRFVLAISNYLFSKLPSILDLSSAKSRNHRESSESPAILRW